MIEKISPDGECALAQGGRGRKVEPDSGALKHFAYHGFRIDKLKLRTRNSMGVYLRPDRSFQVTIAPK